MEETLTNSYQEIMQITGSVRLTRSDRSTAYLAGCDGKTVQRYVDRCEPAPDSRSHLRRPRLIDPYLEKIQELVERTRGAAGVSSNLHAHGQPASGEHDRIAGVPTRHPTIVAAGQYYELRVDTCIASIC